MHIHKESCKFKFSLPYTVIYLFKLILTLLHQTECTQISCYLAKFFSQCFVCVSVCVCVLLCVVFDYIFVPVFSIFHFYLFYLSNNWKEAWTQIFFQVDYFKRFSLPLLSLSLSFPLPLSFLPFFFTPFLRPSLPHLEFLKRKPHKLFIFHQYMKTSTQKSLLYVTGYSFPANGQQQILFTFN